MTIERISDYLGLASLFIHVFFNEKHDRKIVFLWSDMSEKKNQNMTGLSQRISPQEV